MTITKLQDDAAGAFVIASSAAYFLHGTNGLLYLVNSASVYYLNGWMVDCIVESEKSSANPAQGSAGKKIRSFLVNSFFNPASTFLSYQSCSILEQPVHALVASLGYDKGIARAALCLISCASSNLRYYAASGEIIKASELCTKMREAMDIELNNNPIAKKAVEGHEDKVNYMLFQQRMSSMKMTPEFNGEVNFANSKLCLLLTSCLKELVLNYFEPKVGNCHKIFLSIFVIDAFENWLMPSGVAQSCKENSVQPSEEGSAQSSKKGSGLNYTHLSASCMQALYTSALKTSASIVIGQYCKFDNLALEKAAESFIESNLPTCLSIASSILIAANCGRNPQPNLLSQGSRQ